MQGLTGLYGPPPEARANELMDAGVYEARAAPGTATSHGEYGSQSLGYGGPVPTEPQTEPKMTVYDTEGQKEMYYDPFFDPGVEYAIDNTPTTHSAKWPEGIVQPSWGDPSAYAEVGNQMQELHGPDLGGVTRLVRDAPAGHEEPTHYTTDDYRAPNQSMLAKPPGQLRGAGNLGGLSGNAQGGGSAGRTGGNSGGSAADVDQGYGVNNSLEEFNAGHSIRRVQHDHMPWDYSLLHGEQDVPFFGRHDLVGQMSFDGPDSPYYQAGSIDGNQVVWEGRIGDPTQYTQPPEPNTLPASQGYTPDVWAW